MFSYSRRHGPRRRRWWRNGSTSRAQSSIRTASVSPSNIFVAGVSNQILHFPAQISWFFFPNYDILSSQDCDVFDQTRALEASSRWWGGRAAPTEMAAFSPRQTCQVFHRNFFSPSRSIATVPPLYLLLSSKGTVTVLASTITMAFTDYRQSAGRVAATLFQYVVSGFYTLMMEIEEMKN